MLNKSDEMIDNLAEIDVENSQMRRTDAYETGFQTRASVPP